LTPPRRPPARRRAAALVAPFTVAPGAPAMTLALALLAALPFAGALANGLVAWDDDRFITANPRFAGPVGAYVWAALTEVQFEAYQPLHLLSYLPDRLLWPDSAFGFHALNLALYAVAGGLLFALLRRRVPAGAAALACLLFAWHPLLVEPVAWVSARKDLVALILVLGVLHQEDRSDDEGRGRSLWSGLLAAAALLAKSATVVLPVLVLAWHRYARARPWRLALRRAAPSALAAAVAAVLVWALWRRGEMIAARPLPVYWDVAGTIGFYARRVLWPEGLAALYPAVVDGQVLGAALTLAAAFPLAALWPRLPAAGRFALLGFCGALLPVSNLVPLYFRFADRYQWLALLALAWPVAAAVAWLRARGGRLAPLITGACLALLAAEAWATVSLVPAWRDSRALWTHATAAQPRAFFAQIKLAETLRDAGDLAGASRAYLRAVALDRDSTLGFGGLLMVGGLAAEREGKIARGTTAGWLSRVGPALADRAALEALAREAEAGGCVRCGHAITWLSLRRFPRPDAELLAAAARARDEGRPQAVLIFLAEVRDPRSPAYRQLAASLAAGRAPPRAAGAAGADDPVPAAGERSPGAGEPPPP
jgi:protein O-mannosyl-transferase